MTQNGKAEQALGAGLVFSVLGGLFGVLVLFFAAPVLAEFALQFSSFEYFWLVLFGLACAVVIASEDRLKGCVSLLIGLLVAMIGINNPAGVPRFTFGSTELGGGVDMVPLLIGMFAVSEIMRIAPVAHAPLVLATRRIGGVFSGQWGMVKRYRWQLLRGGTLGTAVGALPGAGADIAAWMSYAISKKFSAEPEKFGTGHVEGIVESGAANNSALGGAWIPAIVFGIPGDSITAIAIGVMYMKNLNPGPTLFTQAPESIYAIFLIFIAANLLMLPLGWLCIKVCLKLLRAPRNVLMPLILLACIVGSFAIENSLYAVVVMLAAAMLAVVMERNGFPVGPVILGVVLGRMLEENLVSSTIKADGQWQGFVERPISATLATIFALMVTWPVLRRLWLQSWRATHA